ncbi:MAG: T9SS type A sorting domain-containing protein, partial [Chitinophagales bacterium]
NSTIFAAADNGIYVSYNNGLNWIQRSSVTSFKDIKYCPGDTMTIYATRNGDFYRSTNAGTSWSIVTSGFNATAKNRLAIGVTAANPNIVYILASATTNRLEAFYKSSNKGANFSQRINGTTFNLLGGDINGMDTRGQGWYDLCIIGSPSDSNFVLVGGINIFKSTNGGTSWVPSASWRSEAGTEYVHADIHYFARNPINNEIWLGSDGGVDFSSDNGTTYTSRNNGLTIGQIYNLGVSQRSKTRFISGFQDDGTKVGSTPTNWIARVGGDGMQCEISNFDTTVLFGNVQYGDLRRSTNNGVTWVDMPVPNQPGPWAAPCHLHPRRNDIMVVLYKNAVVSKDIVTAGAPSFTSVTTGETNEGSAIRFSNVNDSLVFLGWENGVFRQANILAATPTVQTMTNPNGGNRISDIETSFNNENVVYCTSGNRVYRSSNKGSTWTNITGNLPDIPMFSIVLDKNSPEGLYVGTDAGVYYKDSLMANWVFYNNGMALGSQIRDLEIVYDTVCTDRSVIYAATYGRGLWKGDLRISETQPNPNFTIPASSCATLPVNITNTTSFITNNGAPITYNWTITPNTFSYAGATNSNSPNPIVVFNSTGNYSITLKASKPYGGFCTIVKNNIINIGSKGNLTLKTTNDTTVCPGDTVLVSLGGMQNYNFTPGTNLAKFNDSFAYLYPIVNTNYMIIGDINGGCFDTTYVNVKMKSSPSYAVSGSTSFCNGDSTTISISNVDTAYWNPSTGITDISATNKRIKITSSNIYNLRLVKSGFCDVKFSLPINVKTIPGFSLSKSFNQLMCLGDSTIVNENNGVPALAWTPTAGIVNLGSNNFRFKPSATTKYILRTTDTNYCAASRDSIQFTMIPKPVITITGPSVVCGGSSVTFTASGADTFKWSPSTYLNKTIGNTVISTPTASQIYTITGITGPCSTMTSKPINVGTVAVNLNVTGNTEACLGSTFNLVVSGADSFKWSPANIVSNEFGKAVRISTNTSTTVKVNGESSGCKDSLNVQLTIRPLPTVTTTKNRSTAICPGEKVSIKAMGAINYSIDPIFNFNKPKLDSFVVWPSQTTKYFIIGYNSFGCQGRDSLIIDVNPAPVITITPTTNTIKRGDSFQITANGGASYEWTPNKYIKGSNLSSTILIKPDSDIVYSVVVTNSEGCTNKGIAIVYVQQNPNPPSGILNNALASIVIYPNPATSELNIESIEPVKATIFSIEGSMIKEFTTFEINQKLNIESLASGNY